MFPGEEKKKTNAVLVLSDGTVYYGMGVGAEKTVSGELVFTTGMVGYQEALTDPSYKGQILTFTYPLIGNYGVNYEDFESERIHALGVVMREACPAPFHSKLTKTIHEFLVDFDVPGISEVDTRAIVRKIRNFGVMPASLSVYTGEADIGELIERAKAVDYSSFDFVKEVASKKVEEYFAKNEKKRVALIDCGLKMSIIRELVARGISVTSVPPTMSAREILGRKPDGLVVSNGPGDPARLGYIFRTIRALVPKMPYMGICMGHQLLAHAIGGKTYKLKFGHRSLNQPVKDMRTGKVYITAQNHGFAVDEKSLPKGWGVSHINCNDKTVEGLCHEELPAFSIQFHPEANPGPLDTRYLFDEYIKML
ncbi:MAG: glutamine-hydrolyzing carbamoyl-phosphate synthase small subunit [Candidatus Micrarchaeia archaeon]